MNTSNLNTLNKLSPGENISSVVRVINQPLSQIVRNKEIIKLKVGDSTNIVNLVAWEPQTKKLASINLNKGDILEIHLGLCPKSHKTTNKPPAITLTQSTILKKLPAESNNGFPTVDICTKTKFLDELSDYSYAFVEVFISSVFNTIVYFCEKCKKFSDKMCDCGNFPGPIFSISGTFSDGTKTIPFTTLTESVAESMTNKDKSCAEKIDIKNLMEHPFTLLGYLRNEYFYVEEIIKS